MCLAIPGKILSLHKVNDVPMGKIDFDGITKDVCLAYVPDAKTGEYVIVHVGFAIERLDEESALETLKLFRLMGGFEEELGILEGGE